MILMNSPSTNKKRFSSPTGSSNRHSIGSSSSPLQISDRFIPSRKSTNLEEAFDYNNEIESYSLLNNDKEISPLLLENHELMSNMLRSELLGQNIVFTNSNTNINTNTKANEITKSMTSSPSKIIKNNIFKYSYNNSPNNYHSLNNEINNSNNNNSNNSNNHINNNRLLNGNQPNPLFSNNNDNLFIQSNNILNNNIILKKNIRKISKIPYKILDAPMLCDDFYLNLLDWSANNVLAVALG